MRATAVVDAVEAWCDRGGATSRDSGRHKPARRHAGGPARPGRLSTGRSSTSVYGGALAAANADGRQPHT